MAIILKNSTFINWHNLNFKPVDIRIEEGIDGKICFSDDPDFIMDPDDQLIDCKGKYVTKSFAIGHHHVYSALARGMGAPKKDPENFLENLQYIWWTLDKALDADLIEASALATAIACARAGSTFVIDHHASPNHIMGSLEIIARAFDQVGVSHLLCYEITDRDGPDKSRLGIEETETYMENHQGLVGLHASFTVGNDTMKKAAQLMNQGKSGIHIHVAEDECDQEQCASVYHKRVVERLHDFGFLESPKSILAHCLHLSERERELIRNSSAFVVENIESNLKNKVGYFNGEGLGDNIMLGTDGMHSDMLRSSKAAYLVGQNFDTIDFESAYKRFRMVHHYLKMNDFKGDGDNNLVILDYDTPTDFNADNFLGHFIFGLNSNHVSDVISNGIVIVKDKTVLTINEADVLDFTRKQSKRLWKLMQK